MSEVYIYCRGNPRLSNLSNYLVYLVFWLPIISQYIWIHIIYRQKTALGGERNNIKLTFPSWGCEGTNCRKSV